MAVTQPPPLRIYWRDIDYTVYRSLLDKIISRAMGHDIPPSRKVLNGISGCFFAGQMTALMGPSGAGKTTLLECLVGKRRTGLSGIVAVRNVTEIKMAVIPQHDKFYTSLTPRETMLFAAKLQNATIDADLKRTGHSGRVLTNRFYLRQVNSILKRLDILNCADNDISACSGSERKRLSVGLELMAKPNLIVLVSAFKFSN